MKTGRTDDAGDFHGCTFLFIGLFCNRHQLIQCFTELLRGGGVQHIQNAFIIAFCLANLGTGDTVFPLLGFRFPCLQSSFPFIQIGGAAVLFGGCVLSRLYLSRTVK